MLGGLAGGLLFRSLFGGPAARTAAGTGAPAGAASASLISCCWRGIGYLIYWYIKKKRQEAAATAGYYQSTGMSSCRLSRSTHRSMTSPRPPTGRADQDLEQGLANIRQFDPTFDEAGFQDMVHGHLLQDPGGLGQPGYVHRPQPAHR